MTRLKTIFWDHKWGQIALLLSAVLPVFLFFVLTDLDAATDNSITLGISTALAIGVIASVITTVHYSARGLSLLAAITGSAIFFFYLFLLRTDRGLHYWMSDFTRALFTVGAPIFATTTIIALIQRTRERRKERIWQSELQITSLDLREEPPRDGSPT